MSDKEPSLEWQSVVDSARPNSARMYNYFLGGKDYFTADAEAARKVLEMSPVIESASRENRHFLRRAVRHLTEQGIRQFLDIGAGLPSAGNVHEIAQDASVVYVDNDPVVIAHARALMARDGHRVRVAQGDARDPEAILKDPAVTGFLDFDRPLGLLMIGLLHFVRDEEGAAEAVDSLVRPLAPGSRVVISHGTLDGFDDHMVSGVRQVYENAMSYQLRTRAEIERFFAGLDLVEPGVVPITDWHPDGVSEGVGGREIGILGGVGRVPSVA